MAADPIRTALEQRPPVMSVAAAWQLSVGTLVAGNVKFAPTGRDAKYATALALYFRKLSSFVPCLSGILEREIPDGERPALAVLLKRIFDATLDGDAGTINSGCRDALETLVALKSTYAMAGATPRAAIRQHRRALSDASFDLSKDIHDYKLNIDNSISALRALGITVANDETTSAYERGLEPDRNSAFDMAQLRSLWAAPNMSELTLDEKHGMVVSMIPQSSTSRQAPALLVVREMSGAASLERPGVQSAISTIRALARPGATCGTCGGKGHHTELCASDPTKTRPRRDPGQRDAKGRVICRNHQNRTCTYKNCRFSHEPPVPTTAVATTLVAPAAPAQAAPPAAPPAAPSALSLVMVVMAHAVSLIATGIAPGYRTGDRVIFVDSGAARHLVSDNRGMVLDPDLPAIVAVDGAGTQHPAAGAGTYYGTSIMTDGTEGGLINISNVSVVPSFAYNILSVSQLNANGISAYMPADGPAYLETADKNRIDLVPAGGLFALVTRPRLHATAIENGAALGDPHTPYAHDGRPPLWLPALLALTTSATPRLASGPIAPSPAVPSLAARLAASRPYAAAPLSLHSGPCAAAPDPPIPTAAAAAWGPLTSAAATAASSDALPSAAAAAASSDALPSAAAAAASSDVPKPAAAAAASGLLSPALAAAPLAPAAPTADPRPSAGAGPPISVFQFQPLDFSPLEPTLHAAIDAPSFAVRAYPFPPAPHARGAFAPGAVFDAANIHSIFGPHGARARAIESAAALGIPLGDVDGWCDCAACHLANLRRSETHTKSASDAARSRQPGHTFDFDRAVGLKPVAVGGSVDALEGICATCGYVYTVDLRSADARAVLAEILAFAVSMRAAGVDVRLVRFDSGREFTAEEVRAALAAAGCHAEYTTTDRNIQNAERAHQICQHGTRVVMRACAGNVPARFWPYARAYSALMHNLTINAYGRASPAADGRACCPYVSLFKKRPDTRAVLPFGCQVACWDAPSPPSSYDRAIIGTYIGPATDRGAGAIWFLTDKTTVRSTSSFRYLAPPNAHLDSTTLRPPDSDGPAPVDERPAPAEPAATEAPQRRSTRAAARPPQFDPSPTAGGDAAWRDAASVLVSPPASAFHGTHADQPSLYDNPDARAAEAAHHPTGEAAPPPTPDPAVPTSLREACEPEHAATCIPAFQDQVDSFRLHDTATPVLRVDVPPDTDIARSMVNFRIKRNGTCKSRWCYDGSKVNKTRRRDPDYGSFSSATPRSSSPTAGYGSLVLLCAVTAHFGHICLQDDINHAYLQGRRAEPVFMHFPYGFSDYMRHVHGNDRSSWPYDPNTHVLRVDGNIWGHPDAGAIWHAVIYPFLTGTLGFTPTPLDPCLLYRHEPNGFPTLLLLFVDDYFVSAAADVAWDVAARISARFQTKGAHIADDALGVDIDVDDNGDVAIHATSYLTRMLARFGYENAKGAKTPLPAGFTADPSHRPEDYTGGSTPHSFNPGEIAGCLVFAAVLRPDLAFAASSLASAVGCWASKHDRAAARVLRYIKATLGRRIIFRQNAPLELAAWVDASFACDIHSPSSPGRSKSRSGCLIFFMGAVLWHASRRQTATALSSCEAELAALCLLARALLVLRMTIEVIFNRKLPPTLIHEDNSGVIGIFRRGDVGGRMRHVRTAISFVLDAATAGFCELKLVPSKLQLANTLTQAEPADRHAWALARLFPTAEARPL